VTPEIPASFFCISLNAFREPADIPHVELQTIPFGIGGRNMEVANLAQVQPASLSAIGAVAPVSAVQRADATASRPASNSSNSAAPAARQANSSSSQTSSQLVSVGAARGNANVSEVQGVYFARSPGPPPESVSASSPSLAMGKLEMMVDIFA
jgi:hypothetical protein